MSGQPLMRTDANLSYASGRLAVERIDQGVVGTDAQEFVDDVPGDIALSVVATPGLDECVRVFVLAGIGIHGVEQEVFPRSAARRLIVRTKLSGIMSVVFMWIILHVDNLIRCMRLR